MSTWMTLRGRCAFVLVHGSAFVRQGYRLHQTREIGAASVAFSRMHSLAAHRHPSAEFREGDAGAKDLYQPFPLMVAATPAQPAIEFDNRIPHLAEGRETIDYHLPSRHPKKSSSVIGLNPLIESTIPPIKPRVAAAYADWPSRPEAAILANSKNRWRTCNHAEVGCEP
ncbi:protein of unknown function (plasmid) [Shinella sp. WSC3-e]|nr:hypothetical protein SHINE37_100369 [Rhizobiaceae bacterium]CAK7261918.1 protein of unknown function [Shinella sp. WSC3-e]